MKQTSLVEKHREAKGKMVDFAGWELPVQYVGIMQEHQHTRSKTGIFDIGHMGEFLIEGEGVEKALDALISCDLLNLPEGKCRYGLLTNEKGGIIDDMITYHIATNKMMIVCNAARREADYQWIKKHLPQGISIADISDETSKIDVQGPSSFDVIELALGFNPKHLKYFQIDHFDFAGKQVTISRTGYTGELGVELYCPNAIAGDLWDALMQHDDVQPIGLGARDTLRLEVGLALYGHELNEEITPYEASLMRFVKLDKEFTGKENILASQKDPKGILVGLQLDSKRAAREGMKIENEQGQEIGWISSGSVAPSLGYAIAIGFVKPEYITEGSKVLINSGRAHLNATVCSLPFYQEGTARRKF